MSLQSLISKPFKHRGAALARNLHSLQTDEQVFSRDELAMVASLELIGAEYAPYQCHQDCKAQEGKVYPLSWTDLAWLGRPKQANQVVAKQAAERKQRDDLEDEARHGNVDARLIVTGRSSRQAPAHALQRKRDDVAWKEDPQEILGREPGQGRGIVLDAANSQF